MKDMIFFELYGSKHFFGKKKKFYYTINEFSKILSFILNNDILV